MSGTPVTPESSSRPRTTRSSRRLIDRMTTHYEEDLEFFYQSVEFDDETTEVLQDKEKQCQHSHSPAESVHSDPPLSTGMSIFNGDLNQPIYCTAGNLMDLMQLMLRNQLAAAETTQRLTTPTPAQSSRDTMRDELREYQKEVKYALDTKSVTTFDGSNYEAWRVGMLADAEVIGGINILLKNQRESPFTCRIDSEKCSL
ncbi:hypothetical protein BDDG_10083 [Blastomyces dermatitidis ATCC 18188]|uniref:Uncharacterized protein n=1 Tax=Ajellomyces dermatitidis (strain ATCC 18188 / CBS 674.68) TaxID=653446 RepID=F2TV68_AJEDA|nr:hypothetical protein BDDG_10083 [Blastomyces dermatitidis ATCC 18188]